MSNLRQPRLRDRPIKDPRAWPIENIVRHWPEGARLDGASLRRARMYQGYTRARLADLLSVATWQVRRIPESRVRAWERDEKQPTARTMIALARLLEVPIGFLWTGEISLQHRAWPEYAAKILPPPHTKESPKAYRKRARAMERDRARRAPMHGPETYCYQMAVVERSAPNPAATPRSSSSRAV